MLTCYVNYLVEGYCTKDTDPININLKQILTFILQNGDNGFYRNEEEFQLAQRDFLTYIMEATY